MNLPNVVIALVLLLIFAIAIICGLTASLLALAAQARPVEAAQRGFGAAGGALIIGCTVLAVVAALS
ncbi:hypothetical protein ACWEPH_26745 [Nocardia beijingensis]